MSACSNLISQLQNIKSSQKRLDQEIAFFVGLQNSDDSLSVKVEKLFSVYKIKKGLLIDLGKIKWELKKVNVALLLAKKDKIDIEDLWYIIDYLTERKAKGESLTKDELSFLYLPRPEVMDHYYELRDSSDGSYKKIFFVKKGVNEVIGQRDIKEDLSILFDCKQEAVGIGMLQGKEPQQVDVVRTFLNLERIRVCFGNLLFTDGPDVRNFNNIYRRNRLPKIVLGNIELTHGHYDIKELVLPEIVRGNVDLTYIYTADRISFPTDISGDFNLRYIKNIDGKIFPKSVGGNLSLNSVEYMDGVELPETVGGYLEMHSVKRAKELVLPKTVGRLVILMSLEYLKGVTLPEFVGGDLILKSLRSIDGVTWPKKVVGRVVLPLIDKASIEKLKKKRPDLRIVSR